MSLGKYLTERLRLMVKEGEDAAQLQTLSDQHKRLVVTTDTLTATLDLFDYDRYSLTLRTLELRAGAPSEAGDLTQLSRAELHEVLHTQAAALARQLNYLEEPLAVWELEVSERSTQLRSAPPQRDEAEVSYWEVTLAMGEQTVVQLARYRWSPEMVERELVPYPASFALLARIAESLGAAVLK